MFFSNQTQSSDNNNNILPQFTTQTQNHFNIYAPYKPVEYESASFTAGLLNEYSESK
jgi:hypothetical protein